MWTGLLTRVSTAAFVASSFRSCNAFVPKSLPNRIMTSSLSAAAGPEKQYLLHYKYIPEVLEKRGPYRQGHLDACQQLIDAGRCLYGGPSGPVGEAVPTGALFIFTDAAAAEEFVQADPYITGGIVTEHSIAEWTVVLKK